MHCHPDTAPSTASTAPVIPDTVIYHRGCRDGFAAAVAAAHALSPGTRFLAAQYNEPPPLLPKGGRVFILDLSFPLDVLQTMAETAREITVLDHHLSAQEALASLPEPGTTAAVGAAITARFDKTKSGCVLAWEHFFGAEPIPEILLYVQARDLWTWDLPEAREINAVLQVTPLDFPLWLEWLWKDKWDEDKPWLIESGRAILAANAQHVAAACSKARLSDIGGHLVPCVNSCVLQSEIGEMLLAEHPAAPFAAIYWDQPRLRCVSLRARPGAFNVAAVAEAYGGGGHAAAAAFSLPEGSVLPQSAPASPAIFSAN